MALGGGVTQSWLGEIRGGGGRPAMDFTFVVGFKRVWIELGGRGLQAEDKKKTEQDVRMRR